MTDKPQSFLRRILRVLSGMRFSVVLLALIITGCVAGSVLPQGNERAVDALFGSVGTGIVRALMLDRVFTAPWFLVCAALLCLNLLLCSILRFPPILKKTRRFRNPARVPEDASASFAIPLEKPADLARLGFKNVRRVPGKDGAERQVSAMRAAGFWGAWLCHLGILLVIVAFAAGRRMSREWVIYGIAGSEQPLGDSGYSVRIDDFRIRLREDSTVEQYEADLVVSDAAGESVSGTASVNHPLSAFGMDLYQDSTGWACYVDIADTGKEGDEGKTDLICTGETAWPDGEPGLQLLFNKFYPDFAREDANLVTRSPLPENPRMLYSLFYQEKMLTMNLTEPGAPIQAGRYVFTMRDPVPYTLIVARRDPTAALAGAAALILLLGIFLAFYVRPQEVWTDGKMLYGSAEKAPQLLEATIRAKLRAVQGESDCPAADARSRAGKNDGTEEKKNDEVF